MILEERYKGEISALTSVMWRVKGLHEVDRAIDREAFDRLADFIEHIAPTAEGRRQLREIREKNASEGDRL